jgi:hypothetical protein
MLLFFSLSCTANKLLSCSMCVCYRVDRGKFSFEISGTLRNVRSHWFWIALQGKYMLYLLSDGLECMLPFRNHHKCMRKICEKSFIEHSTFYFCTQLAFERTELFVNMGCKVVNSVNFKATFSSERYK